jgi:site-specific DNA-methyltransferase (adenine-specific)
VLDPFVGSGTVPVVARRLGRSYLGIDCAEEYCEMARKRLKADLRDAGSALAKSLVRRGRK